MATAEEIAMAMLGDPTQKAIAAENPYLELSQVPQGVGSLISKALTENPRHYPGQGVAMMAGAGLVNGILQGLGQRKQNEMTDTFTNVASKIAGGAPITEEESGLEPSLFNLAKRQGASFFTSQKLENAQKERDTNLARETSMLTSLFDKTGKVVTPNGMMQVFDPVQQKAAETKADTIAKIQGEGEGYGPINPLNPVNKANLEAAEKSRSAIASSDITKNFTIASDSLNNMVKAYASNDKAGDKNFLINFVKALDPTKAIVKENQIEGADRSTAFLGRLGYSLDSFFTGKQTIPPEVKQEMLSAAADNYNTFGETYNSLVKSHQALLKSQGGDPIKVFGVGEFVPKDPMSLIKGLPPQKTLKERLSDSGAPQLSGNAMSIPEMAAQRHSQLIAKMGSGESLTPGEQALMEQIESTLANAIGKGM